MKYVFNSKTYLYLASSILIILPLLGLGYIFSLDMVFGPEIRMPVELTASYPFYFLLKIFSFVLPVWVIQKLLLIGIILLCGIGAHRLTEVQVTSYKLQVSSKGAPYYAGILYIFNPFTYTRFMDGQFSVLLGYALLPFFVKALLNLLFDKKFSWKTSLRLALYALAISIVSIHAVGYMVVISLAALGIYLWQERKNKPEILRAAKFGGLAVAMVLALSSYWMIPTLTRDTQREQLVESFDERYLLSFRTDGANDLSVVGNTLTMNGYWGDREGRYTLPRNVMPLWPILFVAIIALSTYGFYKTKANPRSQTLMVSAAVAVILAIGIAAVPFKFVTEFLVEYVPFYRGFREPQKFVSVLVLFYSIMGALGLGHILSSKWVAGSVLSAVRSEKRASERRRTKGTMSTEDAVFRPESASTGRADWIIAGALLIPLLYTPTMLWGFAGQLKSRNYPADWAQINQDYVQQAEGKTLFLPWHQYMYVDFASRVIANPGKVYFGDKVVAGDNAEIGLIERQSTSDQSEAIDNMIASQDLSNLSSEFTYVLLYNSADWQEYGYLDSAGNLELVRETESLKLYKVL